MRLTETEAPTKSSSPLDSSAFISAMEVTSTKVWIGAWRPCSRSRSRSVPPAMGIAGPDASAKALNACDRLVGRRYSCHRFIGGDLFLRWRHFSMGGNPTPLMQFTNSDHRTDGVVFYCLSG